MIGEIEIRQLDRAVRKAGKHFGYYVRPCQRTRNESDLYYYIGESAESWYAAWGEGDNQLVEFENAVPPDLVITTGTGPVPSAAHLGHEIWQVFEGQYPKPMQIKMFDCRAGEEDPVAITESSLLPGLSSDAFNMLRKYGSCEHLGIGHGSPSPKYPESDQRSNNVQDTIRQGPVLSLDIDGVLAPVNNGLSPFPETPPGFVYGAQGAEAHQAMNGWLERLGSVFPTIVWNSSWRTNARSFAETTGLACAIDWPSIFLSPLRQRIGEFLEPPGLEKLYGLMTMVDPNVPLAVLDDDHVGNKQHAQVGECLLSRPGPTLIVAPNSLTGIGAALVEKLEAWAREPYYTSCIMGMYGTDNYGEPSCFWRHGNCDDPYGYGQLGTGWVEREGGRPDKERVARWREEWWDKMVP